MGNKLRSSLRLIALLLVILTVLMELNIVIIPALSAYLIWILVAAFMLLFASSRWF